MADDGATIHASAVLFGPHAVLIRGPSGSGKSHLVLRLLQSHANSGPQFIRLVADDRVFVTPLHGRLVASPPEKLRGLLEIRGAGLREFPFENAAVVGLVVDLHAEDAQRLPMPEQTQTLLAGISLPRIAVPRGADPLPLLLSILGSDI